MIKLTISQHGGSVEAFGAPVDLMSEAADAVVNIIEEIVSNVPSGIDPESLRRRLVKMFVKAFLEEIHDKGGAAHE